MINEKSEGKKLSMNRWLLSVWFEEPPIVRQKRMAIPLTFQRLPINFWRTPSKWRMQTAHVLMSTFENLYFFVWKYKRFTKPPPFLFLLKATYGTLSYWQPCSYHLQVQNSTDYGKFYALIFSLQLSVILRF